MVEKLLCIPITFINTIKVYFSNKKGTGFNRSWKDLGAKNQLPIRLSTGLIPNKISKVQPQIQNF